MPARNLSLLQVLATLLLLPGSHAVRFGVNGPIVTVTVREPTTTNTAASSAVVSSSNTTAPWIDFSSLKPNILWSIQTQQPPLPTWFPSLKTIKAGIGYSYNNDLKHMPSRIECTGKFALTPSTELQIQPSRDFRNGGHNNLLLQVSHGARASVWARLDNRRKYYLETLRASFLWRLPTATISSLRVTSEYDRASSASSSSSTTAMGSLPSMLSCTVQAVTGGAGRTTAILHVERQHPTLALVYTTHDERHVIAPSIGLYDARVVYQWSWNLRNGNTITTKVDPTSAVECTWTDRSGGGMWVTDVRVPLEDVKSHLNADVRVRRQFVF